MGNFNKVFLMGRLTRDPEQRFLPSGQSVVNFGIAVNRNYTVNNEKREETTFVDIEAWGQTADLIHRYFTKGKTILVEGRLKFDTWETKEGEKRSKLRVVADRIEFVNSAQGQGGGQGQGQGQGGGRGHGGRGSPMPDSEPSFDAADFQSDYPSGGPAGAEPDIPF